MAKQERLIIINADDYGRSEAIDEAIEDAYTYGILTSTTALVKDLFEPFTPNRLDSYRVDKPPIGLGVHLDLTYGPPMRPRLFPGHDFSRPNKDQPDQWSNLTWINFVRDFNPVAVEKEFRAQIQKGRRLFGPLDHLDSHHSVASYYPVLGIYEKLAKSYRLPIRPAAYRARPELQDGEDVLNPPARVLEEHYTVSQLHIDESRKRGLKTVDRAVMQFFSREADPAAAFLQAVRAVKPGEVVEFMFHPSKDSADGIDRRVDYDLLMDHEVRNAIKYMGVRLTTYRLSAHNNLHPPKQQEEE